MNAVRIAGAEGAVNAQPIGITTRKQGSARSGTNGLRNVKTGEAGTLRSQAVQMGGLKPGGPLGTYVCPALIIGENHDDVGRRARILRDGDRTTHKAGQQEADGDGQPHGATLTMRRLNFVPKMAPLPG